MVYTIIVAVIVVGGAVIGLIKREKIKASAQIAMAGIQAAGNALAPGDDTPGKITAEEWGEIVEKIGQKAKEVGGKL
jgi:hypothetical protein